MSDVAVLAEEPVAEAELPSAPALAGAVAGFLVLGLCAGLGASDPGTAIRAVPSGVFVGAGALVLTGPALVVGHQVMGLDARPARLVGAMGDGFVRAGRLALGLSPVMAFFSLTTGLWGVILALLAAAVGAVGFGWVASGLRAVEARSPRMDALVFGWGALSVLVALRLAVDVARLVMG
ncbi:MAG: hypothetical protein H6735_06395 [Alphaproteobacteria bacterium]|nr:hypothetical protein [Alphaproteobacteria bacterium]